MFLYKGIIYKVSYKDDPQYEYEYFYSDDIYALYINKVILQIYDLSNDNKRLEGDDLKNVKYPPIYLDKYSIVDKKGSSLQYKKTDLKLFII